MEQNQLDRVKEKIRINSERLSQLIEKRDRLTKEITVLELKIENQLHTQRNLSAKENQK